jgi:DEAD/DEAH box helicase domain-containing protein
MHTRSVALVFEESTPAGTALKALPAENQAGAVTRLGTVIKNVAPVFLLCEPRDIGIAERIRDPHFGTACLYVYDAYPGGSGLAEAFVEKAQAVLLAAWDLVARCPCEKGCPSCVGPRNAREEVETDPKGAVLEFLKGWLSAWAPTSTSGSRS